jgi:hypothetical protein
MSDMDWQPADETQDLRPHLPECSENPDADPAWAQQCECHQLRACEARVRDRLLGMTGTMDAYRAGKSAALGDAREAVAATKCHGDKPLCRCGGCHANNTATATIDALRGESNG